MTTKEFNIKTFFFGFSPWKHPFLPPFLDEVKHCIFINPFFSKNHLSKALKKGLDQESNIYIWGKKSFDDVETYASTHSIPINRIEDGFIRSVGLGSDLTQPYSLVVDTRGIYFDPTVESDLEYILSTHDFTDEELERAKELRHYLIEKKLSKYNNYEDVTLNLPQNREIVMVVGQVEDDASIRFGASGMRNIELLEQARCNAPDAFIIFKPHPDVLAGNRVGHVSEDDALVFCDLVVTQVSLDSVLTHCDSVHTMTSLVGFEALMRGLKVYTYGLPFYAGWGLSIDARTSVRRQRRLSIDALTAGTLLLYPRYIDPLTKTHCEVETTLKGLEAEKLHLRNSLVYRTRIKVRNFFSRKSQLLLRLF